MISSHLKIPWLIDHYIKLPSAYFLLSLAESFTNCCFSVQGFLNPAKLRFICSAATQAFSGASFSMLYPTSITNTGNAPKSFLCYLYLVQPQVQSSWAEHNSSPPFMFKELHYKPQRRLDSVISAGGSSDLAKLVYLFYTWGNVKQKQSAHAFITQPPAHTHTAAGSSLLPQQTRVTRARIISSIMSSQC